MLYKKKLAEFSVFVETSTKQFKNQSPTVFVFPARISIPILCTRKIHINNKHQKNHLVYINAQSNAWKIFEIIPLSELFVWVKLETIQWKQRQVINSVKRKNNLL